MATAAQTRNLTFFQIARRWSTLALALGTLLIALSGIGLWIQWTVYSEDGFVEVASDVLHSTQTRETIAQSVVDRIFEEHPVLRELVRDPIEGVIIGILGSSIFNTVMEFVARRIWETIFIDNGTVTLDIGPLRDFVYAIFSVIAPDRVADLTPEDLPGELVLLDAGQLPDMEKIASLIAWTTLLSFVFGLAVTGLVLFRSWTNQVLRYGFIAWAGLFLIAEAIILMIASFPTRSTIVLAIDNSTGRTIISTTYDELVQRLFVIMLGVVIIGGVMVGYGLWMRRQASYGPGVEQLDISTSPGADPESAIKSPH